MCMIRYDNSVGFSECVECERARDAEYKMMEVTEAAKELVALLYGSAEIDQARVDDLLGQICDASDVKCPAGLPAVRRARSNLFEFAAEMVRG